MRGTDTVTESPFTFRKLNEFVPASHPLRAIRKMANEALARMGPGYTRPTAKVGGPVLRRRSRCARC
ncbi:hypothetical protein OKW40_000747 [Paraburkholderia sp. RAU6.4a]